MCLCVHRIVVTTIVVLQDLDIEDGEVAEGDALPKASTKKKPLKVEENRSKKEHVNVVFIGHVGKIVDSSDK